MAEGQTAHQHEQAHLYPHIHQSWMVRVRQRCRAVLLLAAFLAQAGPWLWLSEILLASTALIALGLALTALGPRSQHKSWQLSLGILLCALPTLRAMWSTPTSELAYPHQEIWRVQEAENPQVLATLLADYPVGMVWSIAPIEQCQQWRQSWEHIPNWQWQVIAIPGPRVANQAQVDDGSLFGQSDLGILIGEPGRRRSQWAKQALPALSSWPIRHADRLPLSVLLTPPIWRDNYRESVQLRQQVAEQFGPSTMKPWVLMPHAPAWQSPQWIPWFRQNYAPARSQNHWSLFAHRPQLLIRGQQQSMATLRQQGWSIERLAVANHDGN